MEIVINSTSRESGAVAAREGAALIRDAISRKGHATIVVATGASQFALLNHLVEEGGIDWHQVTGFHLDEYVGLPISHGASFRRYLWERFLSKLALPLKAFHFINGEGDCEKEVQRLNQLLAPQTVDVAFVGIGENGHLAFNDPPADFNTEVPYLIVDLDEACRRQQLGEGWFPTLEDVPKKAISMSCRQIMKSKAIICTVPEARKARAVKDTAHGELTPDIPASILKQHDQCQLYLDAESASLLRSH
ncbi:MAG: glucosamine-6-phosphate deaminase [Verrucomicrobiota bacterium]